MSPIPVGERPVHAFVVPDPHARPTAEEVIAGARARIAGYKCPKDITFIEELPVSGIGKVRKDALRALWLEEHGNRDVPPSPEG